MTRVKAEAARSAGTRSVSLEACHSGDYLSGSKSQKASERFMSLEGPSVMSPDKPEAGAGADLIILPDGRIEEDAEEFERGGTTFLQDYAYRVKRDGSLVDPECMRRRESRPQERRRSAAAGGVKGCQW
jgi:hypothetical protein